jgi:hypothetical protein
MQIFYTPEGQLSTEQGVYIAEAVANKNTKLAKGRFRAYDDQDAVIFCSCKLLFFKYFDCTLFVINM